MNNLHPPTTPLSEVVQRLLKNSPGRATVYLEVAAEEATDDIGRAAFLAALRDVAKFRGMTEVAAKAGMKVESLSRALSARGNPTLKTLVSITQAVGMRIAVVPAEPVRPAAKKRKSPRKARV
jgi:probable addiction module antidote protein